MRIVCRPAAVEDLRTTADYLEHTLGSPQAARRFLERALRSISLLRENPRMVPLLSDKVEIDGDMRYLVVSKHLVFYELTADTIEIVRILDGRTDYLSRLFD